jgi:hypothetical protein
MAPYYWKQAAFYAGLSAAMLSSSAVVSVEGFATTPASSSSSSGAMIRHPTPILRMADVAVADPIAAGDVFNPENIR